MKRRVRWALVIFPTYLAASFLGDTRSAGNPFELGLAHGICFGVFAATFLYPLFVMLQAGIHQLVRRLTHGTWPNFSPWEFAGIALWSLLVLSAFLGTSDTAYYRQYVSDQVPASLHDFQSRHTSGFGNSQWVASFRIKPADFPKVIGRHKYTQEAGRGSLRDLAKMNGYLQLPPLPDEPAAECYSYIEPGPGGGLHISIWTNTSHDLVFLSGSHN